MSEQEQQIQEQPVEQPVELSKEEASQQIQPENFDDILNATSDAGDPFAELMQQVEETPEGQHPVEADPVVEGVKPEPVESQGETS